MLFLVNPAGRSDRKAKRRKTATKRARARSRAIPSGERKRLRRKATKAGERWFGVNPMATRRRRRRATARKSTTRRRRRRVVVHHNAPRRRSRRRRVAVARRNPARRHAVRHRRRSFRRNPALGLSLQNVKDALAVGGGELLTAQVLGAILSYLPDSFVTSNPAAATGVASVGAALATAMVAKKVLPRYASLAVAGSLWAGIRATSQQTEAGQRFFQSAAKPLLAKSPTAPVAAPPAGGVAGYSRPALVAARGGMRGYAGRSGYNVSAGEGAWGNSVIGY